MVKLTFQKGEKNMENKEEMKFKTAKQIKDENALQAQIVDTKDQAYTLMNIKDDEQVLAEMRGEFLEEFVYSFPMKGGGKVTGLSWTGVKEIARRQGHISVEDIKVTETPDTYRVLAKAKDIQRNVTMFGIAEQLKKMQLRTGDRQEDVHALSKCVSRAQRNAIRALIPEATIKAMIELYLKKGN